MRAAGVVAGHPHGLHHRLGARHVEGDLVQARDLAQAAHIVGHRRVIAGQHRPERLRPACRFAEALAIEVNAEHIHAVRAGEVDELVAIEIGQARALRRAQELSGRQVLAHPPAEREGHAIAARELQVREARRSLFGEGSGLGEALPEERREPRERELALPLHGDRRAIGGEEVLVAELVVGNQRRHPARQPRVPGERAVLGARQFDAPLQRGQGSGRGGRAQRIQREGCAHGQWTPVIRNPVL